MATISVPPGKSGIIILDGSHLYLNEWDMSLEVDNEAYMHFEQDADVNSLVWKNILTGHVTGDATVRGNFDQTGAAYLPTSKGVWPTHSGTGFLGYTSTVGFTVSFGNIGIRASHGAARPAGATYDARVKILACVFTSP